MNNLLNKLIELDKKAQELDDEIKQEADNLESQIQTEVEAIRTKHMNDAEDFIKKETSVIRAEAEKQWQTNCKKYDISRTELEKNYNNNFDRWVDMIVSDVLD